MGQTTTMKLEDTQFLLEQWARWVHTSSFACLSYPSIEPFRRLLGTTVKSAAISDAEAGIVDATIAKLKMRDAEMAKVVIYYYLSNSNMSYVVDKLNISLNKARILVEAGTSWIDAALEFTHPRYKKAV